MFEIKMKCACGSEATWRDDGKSFINLGGVHDSQGRKYRIEVRADDWLDLHEKCRETASKPQVMAQFGGRL
jgi:hypothetical protein